jgi:outer membrane protein OmpA-like peptidoglycan-associated protein
MASQSEVDFENVGAEFEQEAPHIFQPRRLVGEDAPLWSAIALTLLGVAFALAATASFQLPESGRLVEKGVEPSETTPALTLESPAPAPAAHPPAEEEAPPAPPLDTTERQEGGSKTTDDAADALNSLSDAQAAPAILDCPRPINVPFALGSARPIVDRLETSLKTLAKWIAQHDGATLLVEGHADSIGTEQRNVLLSFQRAKAVVAQLAAWGAPERRMILRAAGASQSIGAPEEAPRNRRVFLRIEGIENCRTNVDVMEQQ